MLVDSHCHLNYIGIKERLSEILARAKNAGLVRLQSISTQRSDWTELARLAKEYPEIFYSIGLHPLNLITEEKITLSELISTINSDAKINSLGETGLDYYKGAEHQEAQQESFKIHLEAAQETGLPVIVHTRDAEKDTYDILNSAMKKKPLKGVLHSFTGSQKLAEAALELGLYISASGIITFKSAGNLREIFAKVPLNRLLIETDSPFLAPVPYRGQVNEPTWVIEVAKVIASIKGITLDEVAAKTTKNYFELFNR
jgi:TatD DNase family protein